MATTTAFKDGIDVPLWRPQAPLPLNSSAGSSAAYDMRNNTRNLPFNYVLLNATTFYAFNALANEVIPLASPALAGVFGAGATCIMHPTQGPRGTIAAGATTSKFTLTTALPAAVAANQLANDGSGMGFTVRVIDNGAGGSGKTEERVIVANTAGTTPALILETALSFTPVTGSAYEIRSGRVFLLSAGTLAAGIFKYYDVATNSFSGNLATTNLPGTIGGDSSMVALSEGHKPFDGNTGEGFLGALTSGAGNTATTIVTGSGGRASNTNLKADEYRNFQVRVVQDATNPTAAGQRRRISTHTAGATPTFTVSAAWTVTPSSAAIFSVENDDDKILLFTNTSQIYNYSCSGNAWDTTTWATAAAGGAAGIVAEQSFGFVHPTTDVDRNARHSHIYRVRGGNVNIIDVFDIAGAATGAWSADIAYGNKGGTLFNTGTSGAYDPVTLSGRYLYLNVSGTQRFVRFDVERRVLEPFAYQFYPQGAALVGCKLHMYFFIDGATKLSMLYAIRNTGADQFGVLCHR